MNSSGKVYPKKLKKKKHKKIKKSAYKSQATTTSKTISITHNRNGRRFELSKSEFWRENDHQDRKALPAKGVKRKTHEEGRCP